MFVDIINYSWHYISGREILVRSFGGWFEELDWLFERKQDNQTHWWYRLFHDGSQARRGPWYSGAQDYKETVLLVVSSYMMDAWCFLRAKAMIKRKDLIYSLSDSLKKSKQKILHHNSAYKYLATVWSFCQLLKTSGLHWAYAQRLEVVFVVARFMYIFAYFVACFIQTDPEAWNPYSESSALHSASSGKSTRPLDSRAAFVGCNYYIAASHPEFPISGGYRRRLMLIWGHLMVCLI